MIGFFSGTDLLIMIAAAILASVAQMRVRRAYARYSKVRSGSGYTGAQVAQYILDRNGLADVAIEEVPGELSDHYDPRDRAVRLSSEIFHSPSLAGISVAAHEVGHAIQHSRAYAPLQLRHALLPVASLGSNMAFPLIFAGMFFTGARFLIDLGIILFAGAVLFQLVTLPVEFNASKRAIAQLQGLGIVAPAEVAGARSMLNAAALTYVASAATAVLYLIRLLLLRGSDD